MTTTHLASDPEFLKAVEKLFAEGNYTIREICDELGATKSDVYSVRNKLTRAGRVQRNPGRNTYSLTEKGQRLFEAGAEVGAKLIVKVPEINEMTLDPRTDQWFEGFQTATKMIKDHFLGLGMLTDRQVKTYCVKLFKDSQSLREDMSNSQTLEDAGLL